jgi:hypothetical protein
MLRHGPLSRKSYPLQFARFVRPNIETKGQPVTPFADLIRPFLTA